MAKSHKQKRKLLEEAIKDHGGEKLKWIKEYPTHWKYYFWNSEISVFYHATLGEVCFRHILGGVMEHEDCIGRKYSRSGELELLFKQAHHALGREKTDKGESFRFKHAKPSLRLSHLLDRDRNEFKGSTVSHCRDILEKEILPEIRYLEQNASKLQLIRVYNLLRTLEPSTPKGGTMMANWEELFRMAREEEGLH